jgi:hypothetical protein
VLINALGTELIPLNGSSQRKARKWNTAGRAFGGVFSLLRLNRQIQIDLLLSTNNLLCSIRIKT